MQKSLQVTSVGDTASLSCLRGRLATVPSGPFLGHWIRVDRWTRSTQIDEDVSLTEFFGWLVSLRSPRLVEGSEVNALEPLAVPPSLAKLCKEEILIVDLADNRGRMRINNDLPQGVVGADGLIHIRGDFLEKSEHRGDAFRMDPVFGLLQAENALHDGIELDNRKGEESESSVG